MIPPSSLRSSLTSSSHTSAGAVYCTFVHPQNLIAGWVGAEAATTFAEVWDRYVAASHMRAHGEGAHAALSLKRWVAASVEGLSDGQRDFGRAAQLRKVELESGSIFAWPQLPRCAQIYLEAAGCGEAYWVRSAWSHACLRPPLRYLLGAPPGRGCRGANSTLHCFNHPGAAARPVGVRVAAQCDLRALRPRVGEGARGARARGGPAVRRSPVWGHGRARGR